jgi:soluble lytic murein transglycosylase-like protein
MPRFQRPALLLLLAGLVLAAPCGASVLYKCASSDGSVAYTSSTRGFTGCSVVSTFPDAPPAKAPPATAPAAAPASADGSGKAATARASGWTYEENAAVPLRADFGDVVAAVASEPAAIVRADFARVRAGASSSARAVVPQDFSTVLADVASSARTIGTPLFIAAPYRTPPRAAVEPPAGGSAAPAARAAPRVLKGAVYRIERRDGITEYTNVKPRGGAFAVLFTYIATCVACDLHSKIDFARTALNLDAYKAEIAAAAADYGVDGALLRAVIHAESAFNPMALSAKGAQGLMQLMPDTAGDLGVTDAFDVGQNIRGGARYLAQLLKAFNGDTALAAAAYNAGPAAVQKYHGVPPYDETQVYVQRVEQLRDRYAKAL